MLLNNWCEGAFGHWHLYARVELLGGQQQKGADVLGTIPVVNMFPIMTASKEGCCREVVCKN